MTMSRSIKIASANLSAVERACLAGIAAQNEEWRHIREIGNSSYAFCKHASEVFDIIFLSAENNNQPAMELIQSLRTVSNETLLVLFVKEGDGGAAGVAPRDLQVDAIVSYNEAMISTPQAFGEPCMAVRKFFAASETVLS